MSLRSTDMAKCLFKKSKCSLWNIECGNMSTLVSLPLSIPLGAVSLSGASVSGMATTLTKKYQKKLAKVMKLTDVVTSVLAVFETSISKALNDHKFDEREST